MTRGAVVTLLACTAIGAIAKTPADVRAAAKAPEKLSVLFILVDDMQLKAVRALGHSTTGSSVINKLIGSSTLFNRCYTMGAFGGALSMPSRAMLMTGRHLFEIPSDGMTIPEENKTLPETLRANGYNTFATGKWHSDYKSFNRSFAGGENIYFGGMHPYANGGHTVPWLRHYDSEGQYSEQTPFAGEKFSSQMYADAAIDFLRSNTDPFFCYVAFTSPHDPINLLPWYSAPLDSALTELPPNFAPQHAFDNGELAVRDETVVPAPRSQAVVREQIALYGGMINEVGVQIGRILSALDRTAHRKNTIVVFASDNGLAMGQHGLMGKQSLYDHSVNVPLAISLPGQRIGKVVNEPCYLADINPTLYDLLDIEKPASVTCNSLIYGHARQAVMLTYSTIQRAVVWENIKYIIYNVGGVITEQLFDLAADPWEMNNLAASQPETVAAYKAKLVELMAKQGDICNIENDVWWDDGHKITWTEGVNYQPSGGTRSDK